ncbi:MULTISPECIES: glucose 1-dehydrogenase [unclassified Spirosoma]|uniref:glucose 1-dehydrogenase n=1 Tax=unclassified Spirosoma TaxID=2621999 RepID=UPI00095A62D4|nr:MULTISPECIES: glucose 1-dehydrogenase [unclassified Spirosoma]MBN8826124.1 glucose 1-dehydrogenase [Spirosoma sp.]OJW74607.1 MAG: sugar dehydrogenase [Spirosoma sp. 48-14]
MDQVLKGQVAIITGASSGIGAGVAKSLAAAGAKVVVNYPVEATKPAADAVLKEITDAGGEGMVAQCDVSQEAQVIQMFADVVAAYGTVDILINNAGLQRDAKFDEMTLDQWNTVINVNLTGQFLCAREAIREFLRRGPRPDVSAATGKIICMSSVHELIPWAGHVNYATSKGGIKMLMQSLAQEYGDRRIRVNSICPGAIQTPINRAAWETPQALNSLMTLIPYNRIGQPQDIGNLAVFLASDLSDYITGASIFIDGGMTVFEGFATGG